MNVPKSVQHSQNFREMYHQSVLVMIMGDIKVIAKPDASTVIHFCQSLFLRVSFQYEIKSFLLEHRGILYTPTPANIASLLLKNGG